MLLSRPPLPPSPPPRASRVSQPKQNATVLGLRGRRLLTGCPITHLSEMNAWRQATVDRALAIASCHPLGCKSKESPRFPLPSHPVFLLRCWPAQRQAAHNLKPSPCRPMTAKNPHQRRGGMEVRVCRHASPPFLRASSPTGQLHWPELGARNQSSYVTHDQ